MRTWIASVMLVAAGQAHAQAWTVDDATFCTTLRGLLDAAGERPAFHSLGADGPARAARGLGFESCRIVPDLYGNRLACSRPSGRAYPTGPATAWRIDRCLPEALKMSEPEGSPLVRYRLGTLALHVRRGANHTELGLFALPVERR